ncbi:MAG: PAS domain-containing hybrid sensor histidine kinase/response regulator, partial [Thermodesulfobacteriota bacterium]
RFLLLMDSLDAAVYVADMNTYEILFMNRYMRGLFGNRVGEICWETFHDGQSGPCAFCTNDRLVDASGRPTEPLVWDHFNPKTHRWWELRDQAILWPDGRLVRMEIAFDISQRKTTEESLRISQKRLRQIIDFLPDATFAIDKDGKVVAWNRAIERMTGVKAEDMLGKGNYEYAIPFYGRRRPVLIDLVGRWNEEAEEEYKYVKKEDEALISETYDCLIKPGGTLWNKASLLYDEHGEAIGAIESIRDITDLKASEQAMRESEQKYRALFEQSRDAIVITDTRGNIIDANRYALTLFGYKKEDMLATNFQELYVNPHDGNRFQKEMAEKGSAETFETRLRKKDGGVMDCVFSAVIRRDEQNTIIGYQGIIRDITESRMMQKKLLESQKKEAIANLAGGIAHRFNNALTTILGNIELLKMGEPQAPETLKTLNQMESSGRHMAHLTSQLLAYARGGKYNPHQVSLAPFLEETIALIEHTLNPDVGIQTDVPPDLSPIHVDTTQMQMVLSALVANANEAMEGPGQIRITGKNVDPNQEFIRAQGLKPGRYVCLSIEDTGKGMDEETQKRIFDPFFTTHFLGRGLGMAAVYGILRNHDGTIEVDSKLDKGSTVRIFLPAAPVAERDSSAVQPPHTHTGAHEATILVIEDEEMVLDLSRAMLERLGYRVLEARTGAAAVEMMKTFDGAIDLVLLDIKLPDMAGKKVYSWITALRPSLKVVVCSGYSIDGPAREILQAGAQDFIQKPFSVSQLSEKVSQVLKKT